MTIKDIPTSYNDRTFKIAYGGTRMTDEVEVLVDTDPKAFSGVYVNGPALRDALLEAFPLEEKVILHETEKKPDVVPGMVFDDGYCTRAVLPDGWYNITDRRVYKDDDPSCLSEDGALVFDPRGAKALPNPLGIRVGDRVRRTNVSDQGPGRAVYTDTTEFEVNHIDGATGAISPKYGAITYNPKGFEVVSREVPDQLPAGTIVRLTAYGDLRLITDDGGIHLTGLVNAKPDFRDQSDYGRLIKDGEAEVIYLPES